MQLSQQSYEVTQQQTVIKDIAGLYLRILQNTQFLTNLIRHQHGRVYKQFSYDIPNVQIKSFYNLIVQTSYLLYTCSIRKASVLFSNNLFVAYQKQGTVQILREFILQAEYLEYDVNKKKQIQANFFVVNPYKYENAYTQSVLQFIKNFIQVIKSYMKKHKQKKNLFDKSVLRQLETLDNAYNLLSSIAIKGLKPKSLISCFQETQLFRTYSYMLKTLNCSLYYNIRKTGKFQQIIYQIKRKQQNLNEGFNFMMQQNAVNYQTLQSSVEDFIRYLIKMSLIDMEISVNSNSNSFDSAKDKPQNRIGSEQIYSQYGDRAYSWKILVQQKRMREFNEKIVMQLTQGETTTVYSSQDGRKMQNLFHIDYIAKKNLLSVWYISSIEVNIENSDALLYHCNNMTMQLNNVTVQYSQRQSNKNNKRKERVLAFKVITHFNIKQNPFINLMLLIDRAMIYGKVCEPEISKKTTRFEDYSRFNLVGKRINHLSNMFIKKIRRLYESVNCKSKEN